MNQRSKRSRDRKHSQDVGASTFSTGGFVASHRRGESPLVRVPQKTTGDIDGNEARGIAKASPFFKKLKEVVVPKSKADEKKVIAAATEKVESVRDEDTVGTHEIKAKKEKKKTNDEDK